MKAKAKRVPELERRRRELCWALGVGNDIDGEPWPWDELIAIVSKQTMTELTVHMICSSDVTAEANCARAYKAIMGKDWSSK